MEVQTAAEDAVEKVTGRPARTFTQWVTEHTDAFTATGAAGTA